MITVITVSFRKLIFTIRRYHNIGGEIANSVDPDQTAPKEQSDQGLDCLLRTLSKHLG